MAKIKHIDVGEQLDSTEWVSEDTHEVIGGGEIVPSNPPSGYYKVTNIYVRKIGASYKLVVQHENIPEP